MICRAVLSQPKRGDRLTRKTQKSAPGWKKCGKGSTTCCPYTLPSTQSVLGQVTGLNMKSRIQLIAEHKQCVRSKNMDKPSGWHFNQQGLDVSHIGGLVLEHVKSNDPFVLCAREYLYIQKFDTYRNGLKKNPWVWHRSSSKLYSTFFLVLKRFTSVIYYSISLLWTSFS